MGGWACWVLFLKCSWRLLLPPTAITAATVPVAWCRPAGLELSSTFCFWDTLQEREAKVSGQMHTQHEMKPHTFFGHAHIPDNKQDKAKVEKSIRLLQAPLCSKKLAQMCLKTLNRLMQNNPRLPQQKKNDWVTRPSAELCRDIQHSSHAVRSLSTNTQPFPKLSGLTTLAFNPGTIPVCFGVLAWYLYPTKRCIPDAPTLMLTTALSVLTACPTSQTHCHMLLTPQHGLHL